jgi:hypothetical protein
MHPIIIDYVIKERQMEVRREVRRQRLLAPYRARRPSLRNWILVAIGDLLIRLGERLKCRYDHKQRVATG